MGRRERFLKAVSLWLTITATACGGRMVTGADFDPAVAMGQPRTFAWIRPDELPVGDPRLDGNPFFVNRLHQAVERELAARGIRPAQSQDADLLVHHHAVVRDRVEVLSIDEQAGYTNDGRPQWITAEVYQFEEGTFLVDVADRRTRRILWRGWAQADLMDALDDSARLADLIDRAVTGMFERFPVAPREEPLPADPAPRVVERVR